MKNLREAMKLLAMTALFCCLAITEPAVQAADISLGLGAGLAPDYEGSEDYEAVPIPYLTVNWANHMSVRWVGSKARVNLVPSPNWKGGVVSEFIPERDDVDSDAVDAMEDVDTSFMLGGFFGYEINNWSASIEAMTDVADGNDGSLVRLLGGYRIPLGEWSIGLEGFTTWADDDYMEAYFGVDASDSARSGLAIFDADSGFKDIGLGVSVNWSPWDNWGLMGLASYKWLLDDAEDSPIVDNEGNENQYFLGALFYYKF